MLANVHRVARITHPQAETNVAQEGTGLGLAICERIVTRHGGAIAATDNPGGGTRVSFTIPAVAPPGSPQLPHHDIEAASTIP